MNDVPRYAVTGAAGAEHALSVARIVRTQRTTSKRRCMGKLLLGLI